MSTVFLSNHPSDKLLKFVYDVKDLYGKGKLNEDHMDKINEVVGVLSLKPGMTPFMISLANTVKTMDIKQIVNYLEENDPLSLVSLSDHPKFDMKRLMTAVMKSKTLEDFLTRMSKFYSTNKLPLELQEDLVSRVEVFVRNKLKASSIGIQLVTQQESDILMSCYSRKNSLTEKDLVESFMASSRRICRLASMNPGLSKMDNNFALEMVKWGWEQYKEYVSKALLLEVQVMTLHHFSDSNVVKSFLVNNYPDESKDILEIFGEDTLIVQDKIMSLLADPIGLGSYYKYPGEEEQKELDLTGGDSPAGV